MRTGGITRRWALAGMAMLGVLAGPAVAQQPPLKIGMGMAQTGGLAGGGKSSLLGIQLWVDDVNAKGGLLGRKVELVVYDDQSSAATTPGIYAKLLDVDKVDILFAPYATVPTAPIMPIVKQRGLLLMGNFSYQVNQTVKHDMWFNNAPWGPADSWAASFFAVGTKAGGKTAAILASDQEFAQNLAKNAKEVVKKNNIQLVYEQNYPPTTVDFSSMMKAIRAAKPDMVFIASYPNDSVNIVRAANEIGVGENVKVFGGGMVGLQFGPIMENLGSLLNGVVNYNTYVPAKTMDFPGTRDFLERYSKKAAEAKVDVLGYYLAPFGYAMGQMLEQAVNATKGFDQKKIAEYLHKNEMQTIVGPISFAEDGERKESATLQIQFRGIADKNIEQFRQEGKQVVLFPEKWKNGDVIVPFEKARK